MGGSTHPPSQQLCWTRKTVDKKRNSLFTNPPPLALLRNESERGVPLHCMACRGPRLQTHGSKRSLLSHRAFQIISKGSLSLVNLCRYAPPPPKICFFLHTHAHALLHDGGPPYWCRPLPPTPPWSRCRGDAVAGGGKPISARCKAARDTADLGRVACLPACAPRRPESSRHPGAI